jgi:hypothetical protein
MNNHFQPEIQDEAMDAFRKLFSIPLTTHVVAGGRLMRMRVVTESRAIEYLAIAQTLISANRLPLTPRIADWKVCGCIFDRWLEIEFDASKLIPINY